MKLQILPNGDYHWDIPLRKDSIEEGDIAFLGNDVGVVRSVRYNDADEVEIDWFTTNRKTSRNSIEYLKKVVRISYEEPVQRIVHVNPNNKELW